MTTSETYVIEFKPLSPVARLTLIIIGTLALGLAILGLFLPGLPTTPFLLLATGCYARSSDRLYRWVLTRPWLQAPLRAAFAFKAQRALPVKVKLLALSVAWGSCVLTVFSPASVATQIIVAMLALACTVAMAVIRTVDGPLTSAHAWPLTLLGILQQLSYGAVAGALGGLLWGVAGRTIMRFVANVAEKPPQFNLRLTLMMLAGTALIGLLVGVAYAATRRWWPGSVWVKGVSFGLFVTFTLGAALYATPYMQADIARVGLEWRPLIVALFIPNFVAYGLITALTFRRLARER